MDNKNIVKTKIAKPLGEIAKVCRENKIPFFFAVPVFNDEEKTDYYTEILSPAVAEQELTDDKITKMLNVMNGFDTLPPREPIMAEF